MGCSASAKQKESSNSNFRCITRASATKLPNSGNRRERTNQSMLHRLPGGRSTNLKCIQLSSAPESRFVPLSPSRPFCADVTHPGFPTSYTLAPATTDIVRLKLKEHIHTTSIYTELCFICYKISPLVFFLVSLLPTVYLAHERLMILNLACFKAFCSSVGRRG